MMKRVSSVMILIFVSILAILPCAYGMRYDGPYSGRVIDADTGMPIEGAVVLGVWNTEKATPGGAVHDFYDARETLTDKNGDFELPGMGVKILSNVTPMDVLIFKAGYEHIGLYPWASLKEDILLRKKIKWEGKKAIIPLNKLTMEERRKRILGKENFPIYKQKYFVNELNKEYFEAKGFSPYKEVK